MEGADQSRSGIVIQFTVILSICRLYPRSRLHVHQWDGDQHVRVLYPAEQVRHPGGLRPPQEGGEEQEPHGESVSHSALISSKFPFVRQMS